MRSQQLALISFFIWWSCAAFAQGGELRFCLHAEPKTFNPLQVADDASVSIRYLTGGVLVRMMPSTKEPRKPNSTSVSPFLDGQIVDLRR